MEYEQQPLLDEEAAVHQQPELPELPQAPPLPEQDLPKPLRERHPKLARKLASVALVGATLLGIANQPSLREDAAATLASEIYHDTPLGWADQAFNVIIEHEAGWDKPVYTTIQTYHSPEHPTPQDAKVTNILIPGFREMHGEEIAQQLADATGHNYPTRYTEYGNQPVTPDSLAHLIIKNLEGHPLKSPEIGFTGHSMGGVLLLEALARVHEMGYKLPKIAFIDFLSTPAGMQTARFSGIADFFAKTGIGQKAPGILVTETLQQMDAQRFKPSWYLHDITKAWRDLPNGASDALTASQLQDLDKINSQQALHNLLLRLKGVISLDTKVTYFGPLDPSTDTVVDDIASFDDFSVQFKEIFDISINYVWWGDGHANPDFNSNSRARKLLNLSMAPRVTPKPISPTAIPGITTPSPDSSESQAPPIITAAGPTQSASPSPSP